LYQAKKAWQWLRASSRLPKRSGKSGRYLMVLFAPGLANMVLDVAPQLLVLDAQHLGRLAHRQALTQYQCPHLKRHR
jgi:hypothetical protein